MSIHPDFLGPRGGGPRGGGPTPGNPTMGRAGANHCVHTLRGVTFQSRKISHSLPGGSGHGEVSHFSGPPMHWSVWDFCKCIELCLAVLAVFGSSCANFSFISNFGPLTVFIGRSIEQTIASSRILTLG